LGADVLVRLGLAWSPTGLVDVQKLELSLIPDEGQDRGLCWTHPRTPFQEPAMQNPRTPVPTSPLDAERLTAPWDQPPAPALSFLRRAAPLAAIGSLGVLALALPPVPTALLQAAPALAELPVLVQKAVLLVNPWLLTLGAAALGAATAHRAGLRSVLAGTARGHGRGPDSGRDAARGLAIGAVLGATLGLVLAAADAALAPHLGPAWQAVVTESPRGVEVLVSRALYGGLAEEVMLRWGVMSLVAWGLLALLGPRHRPLTLGSALVVSAGLFAAAHLPALAALIEPTGALIARTLVFNGLAGLLYGALFWRHHLEAAMVAHAATHVGMAAWQALSA
jgi:hypothetical protein